MSKLILLRHLKSQWNKEFRFTGWVDVPLAKIREKEVKEIAGKIFKFRIDKIYTSPLFRNKDTVAELFKRGSRYPIFVHLDGARAQNWAHYQKMGKDSFPVFVSEKLNERYYGRLQGENKKDIMKKYGKEKVRLWRRGYSVAPPGGESLKDVVQRAVPFYRNFVKKDLRAQRNVLMVASHNSLRAIVKYIEGISDNDIINLEIPYAGIRIYEFDRALKLKSKKYDS